MQSPIPVGQNPSVPQPTQFRRVGSLYVPDLPFGGTPAALAANDGQVFTEQGNGWLGYNTQGKTFRVAGVLGTIAVPIVGGVTKNANYTLIPFVDRVVMVDTTAGVVTITLPDATDLAVDGQQFEIIHTAGANNMVLVPRSGQINGAANITTNVVGKGYRPIFSGGNYFAATS